MPSPAVEVVHIGSAARDIAPDDPRGWRLGGGVTYAALTTARLGLRTAAVVGVDPEARRPRSSTRCVTQASTSSRSSYRKGRYSTTSRRPRAAARYRWRRVCPSDRWRCRSSWMESRSWSLVPVANEVPDGWVDVIPDDAMVGVAWQGMLREMVPGGDVQRVAPSERASSSAPIWWG